MSSQYNRVDETKQDKERAVDELTRSHAKTLANSANAGASELAELRTQMEAKLAAIKVCVASCDDMRNY